MPITAKLSREFYERFGDKVVNEMVDLFNRIDEASRSDLRHLNEQNAARFEARLDQRSAELRAEIEGLDAKLDQRTTELRAEIENLGARLQTTVETALHTQARWMIGAWVILMASQIALWLR